jgi:hypothetical protein
MANAAVLIGIDDYEEAPLSGCEADATELASILGRDFDEARNFHCELGLAKKASVLKSDLVKAATELFTTKDLSIALFYFSGHGKLTNRGGFLVPQDATRYDEGMHMADLLMLANNSSARERVIVLDCCHSGAIDELFGSSQGVPLSIGVSLLAACRSEQVAVEKRGRGLFTRHVCDALLGGAADIRGFVSVPSIYAYTNEVLTIREQRPLLKANVAKLASIRRASPAISDHALRKIVTLFPKPDHNFPLDPSFEPTAEPRNSANEANFGVLQQYRAARLLVPHGEDHLYYAAINSAACRLTPLGQHYWKQVQAGKI